MTERIGIVTGGDCAGLNAVVRAVVKPAALRGVGGATTAKSLKSTSC